MSGQDIHNFFEKHLPDIFKHLRGIVSIDMISTIPKLQKGEFLVFNQSTLAELPGTHWIILKRFKVAMDFWLSHEPTRAKLYCRRGLGRSCRNTLIAVAMQEDLPCGNLRFKGYC